MTNRPVPDRPVAGDWLALREPADAAAREDSLPLIAAPAGTGQSHTNAKDKS